MARVVRWILGHRIVTILAILLPTLYFAWNMRGLEVHNDVSSMFHPNDPDLLYYQNFYKEFGNDEFLAVYFPCDNVFDLHILMFIDRLTKSFRQLPDVDGVLSITGFRSAYNQGDTLVVGALEDELPYLKSSDMETIRQRILSDPLYYKTLLVRDGKAAGLIIPLKKSSELTYKRKVVNEVRRIVKEEEKKEGIKIAIGGVPLYLVTAEEAYERDGRVMTPLLLVIVFLVLFSIFRYFWLSAVPLMIAGVSVVWTLGFVGLIGRFLTPLTEIVLPLLLVYGVLNGTHFLSAYRQRLPEATGPRHDAILKAVNHVAAPCLWASVTTAIGFLSLLTSSVTIVQDFGLYCAFGVMVSYLLTFAILPLGLDRLAWVPTQKHQRQNSLMRELALTLSSLADRYRRAVILGALGLVILFGFWASQVTVDTNYLKFFRKDTEVIRNERLASSLIGSWAPVEFSIRYDDGKNVLDYSALRDVEKLQVYLESLPSIDKSLSVADILKKANQELHGGDPVFYTVPKDKVAIERLAIFLESFGGQRGLSSYLSEDWSRTRLTAYSSILPSKEFVKLFDQIEEYIQKNIDSKLNIELTGDMSLSQKITVRILNTEIQSFSLAFVLIFIVIMFALRSWRLALVAIPPNVFPVVVMLGTMAKAQVSLDVGTCTIASILISMAVDDSVHLLHRFRGELAHRGSYEAALKATMEVVGPPVVYTSFVLAAGFLVLVFSSYVPLMNFGFLSGLGVMAALVGDVMVLPALLMWLKPIRITSPNAVHIEENTMIENS